MVYTGKNNGERMFIPYLFSEHSSDLVLGISNKYI